MDNEQLEILKILKENHLRELNNHNTTGMDNYNLLKENSISKVKHPKKTSETKMNKKIRLKLAIVA